MAGEGIEYVWALVKNAYRRILLSLKRGKDNFMNCVRECFSKNLVTTERVRKFARRARRYTKGYHVLHQIKKGAVNSHGSQQLQNDDHLAITTKIEQMVQNFKTHRYAMDFDHGFCKTIFKEANTSTSTIDNHSPV